MKWLDKFNEKVSYKTVATLHAISILLSSSVILFIENKFFKDFNMVLLILNGVFFILMLFLYNKYERTKLINQGLIE